MPPSSPFIYGVACCLCVHESMSIDSYIICNPFGSRKGNAIRQCPPFVRHLSDAFRILAGYQVCQVTYQIKIYSTNLTLADQSQNWIQDQAFCLFVCNRGDTYYSIMVQVRKW